MLLQIQGVELYFGGPIKYLLKHQKTGPENHGINWRWTHHYAADTGVKIGKDAIPLSLRGLDLYMSNHLSTSCI